MQQHPSASRLNIYFVFKNNSSVEINLIEKMTALVYTVFYVELTIKNKIRNDIYVLVLIVRQIKEKVKKNVS
ncbi:hypothetical protein D7Y06_01810 [Roseburia sp. 1XD42-69]|nr:hypothetical protein D7Y06_01810 [Roseburia sp. 1XD42-69]